MDDSTKKIEINGATSGTDSALQNDITLALLQNGGVARIQRSLKERLDEAGWSQALREYVEHLMRSGEASTYDEVMGKVMQQIKAPPTSSQSNGVNGSAHAPNLRIPQSAKEGGAEQVRKELEQIVEMKK